MLKAQEKSYDLYDSKEYFLTEKVKMVKSFVKIGQRVSNQQQIVIVSQCATNTDIKLKVPQGGKVLKVALTDTILEENSIIFEIQDCDHPFVMQNLCASCGKKMKQEDHKDMKSIPGQRNNSDIKLNATKANEIECQIINKLETEKKLILILDLDNTLLHTSDKLYSLTEVKEQHEDIHDFQVSKEKKMRTRFRPFLLEFFTYTIQNFEIFIYTMGDRKYAENICFLFNKMFLDHEQTKDFKIRNDQIISRDDNKVYGEYKNLENLFPNNKQNQLILDDRTDVWQHCKNHIPTEPYYYFPYKDKQINSHDQYLKFCIKYLKKIHDEYFQQQEDVRQINQRNLKNIFKEYQIVFSGIFLKDEIPQNNQFYKLAKFYGAQICPDFQQVQTDLNVFLIVREFRITKKIKLAQQKNIPIIHQTWIPFSLKYLKPLHPDIFNLQLHDISQMSYNLIEQRIKDFY